MTALDYIRIIELSDVEPDNKGALEVTFAIEFSDDREFSESKPGVITFKMSDVIDTSGLGREDVRKIAVGLVSEIFVREKDEEGFIDIYHVEGQTLAEWLLANTPYLNQ
ncbi:MAG: hypothetical protein IT344_02920 [Candidatus Dadabacteria bacterium]|nr:hypothetical protein [Candidatus Dadabacteria bacterium]